MLCRAELPHKRSLVKRFEGEPFVLIGVNSDPDWDRAREAHRKDPKPWRSWWDQTVHGPLAHAWRVTALPFYVVIDRRGVVRSTNVRGRELESLLARLVGEAP